MDNLSDKQKILHVVEALGAGIFTYIVDLLNMLCEEYEVYLAYATRPQTPANFRDYFDKRIKLIEVKSFTRSINPVKDIKAFFEIKKIANRVEPDLIHLHSSKAGVLGRWAFNGHKTPMFYTPHGYSFLMRNCGVLIRTLFKLVEIISSKRYCMTISCSSGEHEETLKFTKRATYINNGIDIEMLQQAQERCSMNIDQKHVFTVCTLGRICYQKNPSLFNEVAKLCPDIKFLWIGDGELRDKLTSPNIEVTGWVNRNKALEYSLEADVFMLISLWEGLPISLLEAMFMKKLCVVSNVTGNCDVIKNGVNGFVCSNVNEFVKALNYAKAGNNSDKIECAYDEIMKEYNVNVMGKKYSLIYKAGMM